MKGTFGENELEWKCGSHAARMSGHEGTLLQREIKRDIKLDMG